MIDFISAIHLQSSLFFFFGKMLCGVNLFYVLEFCLRNLVVVPLICKKKKKIPILQILRTVLDSFYEFRDFLCQI